MGNAWYLSPLDDERAESLRQAGVSIPAGGAPSTAPSPDQVFEALRSFPEYEVRVRRRDRGGEGQSVAVELRLEDGTFALGLGLLKVRSDDQAAGVFLFDYYQDTEPMVRLVAELARSCGPLVLDHDSGGEGPIVVGTL